MRTYLVLLGLLLRTHMLDFVCFSTNVYLSDSRFEIKCWRRCFSLPYIPRFNGCDNGPNDRVALSAALSARTQGMEGVHLSARPENRCNINWDPNVLELRYKRIERSHLHVHGMHGGRWRVDSHCLQGSHESVSSPAGEPTIEYYLLEVDYLKSVRYTNEDASERSCAQNHYRTATRPR